MISDPLPDSSAVSNIKRVKVPCPCLFIFLNRVDPGGGWTVMAPPNQTPYLFLRPFGQNFNFSIRPVHHPSKNPKARSLSSGGFPEPDSLNLTLYDKPHSYVFCALFHRLRDLPLLVPFRRGLFFIIDLSSKARLFPLALYPPSSPRRIRAASSRFLLKTGALNPVCHVRSKSSSETTRRPAIFTPL